MSGRILVIKLGAFGDFVMAFAAFAAIRAHHPDAHITLLTTRPYVAMAEASPWFDGVWSEGRPPWRDVAAVLRLGRRLRDGRFDRVYDLQTSRRSSLYRGAVGFGAEWSGTAPGASHRHDTPRRTQVDTATRHREQLGIAGIAQFPEPAMGWLMADLAGLDLPAQFWLMIPGASARIPQKRWPAGRYAALARSLALPAVVVGGPGEQALAAEILAAAPGALDFSGQRSPPPVLAALAKRAAFAVGNDTGPTHLVAACGCPTLALFGPRSDPARSAPRGTATAVLPTQDLAALGVEAVRAALGGLVGEAALAPPVPPDAASG